MSFITAAYVYTVVAAVCDFTIGILPIFLIWNLHMNPRAKFAVAGILSMGCVYGTNALNVPSCASADPWF